MPITLRPLGSFFLALLFTLTLFISTFFNPLTFFAPQHAYADTPRLPSCYMMPEPMVEGVNVLSGGYCADVTDLSTEGVDPIALRRHWSSQERSSGWNYAITKHLYLTQEGLQCILFYPDGQGGTSRFSTIMPVHFPIVNGGPFYPPPGCDVLL